MIYIAVFLLGVAVASIVAVTIQYYKLKREEQREEFMEQLRQEIEDAIITYLPKDKDVDK